MLLGGPGRDAAHESGPTSAYATSNQTTNTVYAPFSSHLALNALAFGFEQLLNICGGFSGLLAADEVAFLYDNSQSNLPSPAFQ